MVKSTKAYLLFMVWLVSCLFCLAHKKILNLYNNKTKYCSHPMQLQLKIASHCCLLLCNIVFSQLGFGKLLEPFFIQLPQQGNVFRLGEKIKVNTDIGSERHIHSALLKPLQSSLPLTRLRMVNHFSVATKVATHLPYRTVGTD